MRRLWTSLIILFLLGTGLYSSWSQAEQRPQPGDPPVATLISVSTPDEDGIVTVAGAAGTIFPSGFLAVRNLYTQETVFVQAGVTGNFAASLFGPGNTPFLIVPMTNPPPQNAVYPGSLPGGPGTIIYGSASNVPPAEAATMLAIDGDLSDWANYDGAQLLAEAPSEFYGLANASSLYAALDATNLPQDAAQILFDARFDDRLYTFTIQPDISEDGTQTATTALLSTPNNRDAGTLQIAFILNGETLEVRFPLDFEDRYEVISLGNIRFVSVDDVLLADYPFESPVLLQPEETDGIYWTSSDMPTDAVNFTLAGRIDAGIWSAQGRANTLTLEAGDPFHLEFDMTLQGAQLPLREQFAAGLALQPIGGSDGAVADAHSNNGWSNVLTPSGLAIDNLTGGISLGEAATLAYQLVPSDAGVLFPLDFNVTLPEDLPDGLYVPVLRVAGGDLPARLPLVLSVGDVEEVTLPFALLLDDPSDGSRGILPDDSDVALSNRVRFNSPTYILPPGDYPVEAYLPNMLPNRYDMTLPPLIPLLLPNGRMNVEIIAPDNARGVFDNLPVQQNQLSTPARDEATLFGRQSPLDIYRLTTGDLQLAAYPFDQYGEYQITLTGELIDMWENQYTGGGEYRVIIAEPLDLSPSALPGTPFEVGDALNPGLRLTPGVPADVTIRVRVYPLDGSSMIEQTFTGQANRYGYFHAPENAFVFETPGEYVIDYDASYRASDGRLWAASLRSAGVIATPADGLIAHGERGLAGYYNRTPRPAWYSVGEYSEVMGVTLDSVRLNTPYHSGDVAWLGDGTNNGMQPIIRVQDFVGDYAGALITEAPEEEVMRQRAREAELPVTMPPNAALTPPDDRSYTYFSAARPGVTIRQLVEGSDDGGLLLDWDSDDPYNGQIGAGFSGDLPGDFMFIFGGAVVRPQNEIAIYASLAVVTDDPRGARLYPPGRGADGGGDGGPLLVIHDQPVDMFFHPTGVRPGDALVVGNTLSISGQVAPALPANVNVTITAPSGMVRTYDGVASSIGYFYDPDEDFVVTEAGVWAIDIGVSYDDLTSAGQIESPPPSGGVLGSTSGGRFLVYVLPQNAVLLPWNQQLTDATIPAALPFNFNFTIPDGWTDVKVYRTLTIPGYILEDGELRLSGRSFSYQYNPTNLRLEFPNVEVEGRVAGAAASDPKTLTFVITGLDVNGDPQIRTRVFTILHDRLISLG